jgi:predicted RNase H-like nuclease
MRFVGVDLAWGGRRPSGLAVLDPGGAVVALDAPLVVEPGRDQPGVRMVPRP